MIVWTKAGSFTHPKEMGDGTDNIAFPDPANVRAQFGSFNMDNSYANNAAAFEVGPHTRGDLHIDILAHRFIRGWMGRQRVVHGHG